MRRSPFVSSRYLTNFIACSRSSSACLKNRLASSVSCARWKCAAMLTYCRLAPNSWPICSLKAFASLELIITAGDYSRMQAMALTRFGAGRLEPVEMATPGAAAGEIVVRVLACGVCRTDLHVVDGELPHPAIPIVPGHEIVGRVESVGAG